ncbi:NUDIX hydrolase [Candidatus Beckwithbacteria bacterium]|nr:NUDIX hydrolase [Candidatus Beckwithbacteria bacterium]
MFCANCGQKMKEEIPPHDDRIRQVCPSCGFIFYNNPKPTVVAIIEKEEKVLLAKRARDPYKDCWDLIGGFVETGETLEEALVREVKEEVNLDVLTATYYFNHIDTYKNAANGFVSKNLGVHFIVKVKDFNTLKPGDDVFETAWFSWANLPKDLVGFEDVVAVIQKRKKELGF